jgi:hypothetical protein
LKFKSIFILFNLVIIASFVFVFAMPFFALGPDFARTFWLSNWPLALVLVLILGGIDGFFISNQRLFSLLEREDWPALVSYLEDRVVKKGRYSSRLVRLLANTYLVLSDSAAVVALEAKVAAAKPALLDKNALVFAVARILANDPPGAASFLAERKKSGKVEAPEWVQWYHAFSLLLNRDFSGAADVLLPLASIAKDPLVIGLSASFMGDSISRALPERKDALAQSADAAKQRVLKGLPTRAAWDKETERARSEIHVVILSKSLEEAAKSIYGAAAQKPAIVQKPSAKEEARS